MSRYVNNKIRIKREETHSEMSKKLTETMVFETYRDVLMVSAAIGYLKYGDQKLEKVLKTAETILMQYFSEYDYDTFDLLAYVYTKDQSIIKDDEKYEIFSSYTKAGFPFLLDALDLGFSEPSEFSNKELAFRYYDLLLYPDEFKKNNITDDDITL